MRKSFSYPLIVFLLAGCGSNPSPNVDNKEASPDQSMSEDAADLPAFTETKDASGKVVSSGYLLHGKKESTWTDYYDSGIPKSVTTYYHDKKEGIAMEFTTNGSISKRSNYHNDQREGEYREYTYGNIREERTYINGKIEGVVKVYYDNILRIMEEGNYKNGVREGVSKWYDLNGNVSIEYTYKNGELVKK